MIIWPSKPPAAVEKYAFDFTDALNGATISGTPTVTATGVTKTSESVSGNLVQVLLSGGTEGSVATVSCSLITTGGETLTELAVLPIALEAVSLATAKAAQKIETTDEDVLLAGFLRAAIRTVETLTSKNLTQQIETQVCTGFSERQLPIRLWKGPVSQILEIRYDDRAGNEQLLSSFRLVEGKDAKLLPAYGECWPLTADGSGTVRISYVAGYDPADRDLSVLAQAVILLFGHFNSNREAVVAGNNTAAAVELPLGVQVLIEPYRSPGIA
jgi:uncharacterized phiE125 gp8 family phage protein